MQKSTAPHNKDQQQQKDRGTFAGYLRETVEKVGSLLVPLWQHAVNVLQHADPNLQRGRGHI
jgi:hypothetical protein